MRVLAQVVASRIKCNRVYVTRMWGGARVGSCLYLSPPRRRLKQTPEINDFAKGHFLHFCLAGSAGRVGLHGTNQTYAHAENSNYI